MELAQKFNVDKSIYASHLERLRTNYGLNDKTIEEAELFSADSNMLNQILKRKDLDSDGIVIPYPGKDLKRARLDNPLIHEDKEIKYLSPSGSTNSLFIPRPVYQLLADTSHVLFFTEGEFKALKAYQEGFPCIGLPGIWGFQSKGELLDDLNLIEFRDREVVVVLDSDAKYNQNVQRAGVYFAIELSKLGAKTRTITLPDMGEFDNESRS